MANGEKTPAIHAAVKRWLLILLLSGHSAMLLAAPSISVHTRYYPVYGADSPAILKSILQNGPVGKDGKRYHAYTQWDIRWGYRWVETRKRCQLASTSVSVEIEYLLPELKTTTFREKDYRKKWDRYFNALLRHEQQHKDLGVQAAREIDAKLAQAEDQPGCAQLKNRLDAIAEQVIEKYADKERAFDRETAHGARQGVALP